MKRQLGVLVSTIFCLVVAPIFAGEPLPAKLKKRKAEYVQGLTAADRGDLKPLEALVLECFQQQIAELVAAKASEGKQQ